jgi:pSer/pThr/pTyr-binding forkhead associated (FHA) protein
MSVKGQGYHLRVREGRDKGRTFALDTEEITVGRARNPTDRAPGWILLNDPKVSRIHVDLRWNEKQKTFTVVHRSDTNPTRVNGKVLALNQSVELKVSDRILVGDSDLDVQQADQRFGAPRSTPLAPARSVRSSARIDGEKTVNTLKADRKVALTQRPDFHLGITAGPGAGLTRPLTGLRVAVGGPALTAAGSGGLNQLELPDLEIPAHYLLFVWSEMEQAFAVSRRADAPVLAVELLRSGGKGSLRDSLPADFSVLLKAGDHLKCGSTSLALYVAGGVSPPPSQTPFRFTRAQLQTSAEPPKPLECAHTWLADVDQETDLLIVTAMMAALTGAGCPFSESLRLLRKHSQRWLTPLLSDIERSIIGERQRLSVALQAHPDVFCEAYVAMVEMGEAGDMARMLDRLYRQIARDHRQRTQLSEHPQALGGACRNLADLLTDGTAVSRALELVVKTCRTEALRTGFAQIAQQVNTGAALADCRYPALFPRSFSGLVAAYERAGQVSQAFLEWADLLEKTP